MWYGHGGAPPFCGCDEGAEASVGGFLAPELVGKCNTSLLFKNNSLERAVDWIFSHIDDLDAEAAMDISEGRSAADSISESVPVGPKVRDGPGSECPREIGQAWWDAASLLPQVLTPRLLYFPQGQSRQKLPFTDVTPGGGILGGGDRLWTQYLPTLPETHVWSLSCWTVFRLSLKDPFSLSSLSSPSLLP